jgi:hypothetical protein
MRRLTDPPERRGATAGARTNQSTAAGRFFGREPELARVKQQLSLAPRARAAALERLVTIVGPPGIGKTRLGAVPKWRAEESDHFDRLRD